MFVVNHDELVVQSIHVEFLLKYGEIGIDRVLGFVVVGGERDKLLAVLLGGTVCGVLNHIARTDKLEQRANVRFLLGFDGFRGSGFCGSVLFGGLHGRIRSTLDCHKKCSDVNDDERDQGFHNFTSSSTGGSWWPPRHSFYELAKFECGMSRDRRARSVTVRADRESWLGKSGDSARMRRDIEG